MRKRNSKKMVIKRKRKMRRETDIKKWQEKESLVWFYGISTIVGYLMLNPFFTYKLLFQTIHFSISTIFCLHRVKYQNSSISIFDFKSMSTCQRLFHAVMELHLYLHFLCSYILKFLLYTILSNTVLNRSIWSPDGTLLETTTLGQSGPGSNGSKRVLHTPQISKTGASLSDAWILITIIKHLQMN